MGENGAGKTTTIKMLTGLMPPTSGQAFLKGHDIARNPLAAKQVLGYIPDNPPLYDKLTGREFMEFRGRFVARSRKRGTGRAYRRFIGIV